MAVLDLDGCACRTHGGGPSSGALVGSRGNSISQYLSSRPRPGPYNRRCAGGSCSQWTARVSDINEKLARLKQSILETQERLKASAIVDLAYVSGIVVPRFQDAIDVTTSHLEKRHSVTGCDQDGKVNAVHYTSIRRLVEMLHKQRSFRLYDSIHLNDPTEGRYLTKHLANSDRWHEYLGSGHAYIASFILPREDSSNDVNDDLMFWRTYGREGEGCALKVRIPQAYLKKVLYDPSEVNYAVSRIEPLINSMEVLSGTVTLGSDAAEILTRVNWCGLGKMKYLYKSDYYSYENECRVVIAESDADPAQVVFEYLNDAKGRPSLRHYVEYGRLRIDDVLDSESSITLGPCVLDREDLEHSLRILALRAAVWGPCIKSSRITYRQR